MITDQDLPRKLAIEALIRVYQCVYGRYIFILFWMTALGRLLKDWHLATVELARDVYISRLLFVFIGCLITVRNMVISSA